MYVVYVDCVGHTSNEIAKILKETEVMLREKLFTRGESFVVVQEGKISIECLPELLSAS